MTKFVNIGMTNFVQKGWGIFPQDGISVRMKGTAGLWPAVTKASRLRIGSGTLPDQPPRRQRYSFFVKLAA